MTQTQTLKRYNQFGIFIFEIFNGDSNSTIDSFAQIASTVNQNIDLHFASPDITVIAEPERFYVESAYTLACQIHSKREVHRNDKFDCIMYYINDGVYGSMSNYLYQRIITSIKTSYPKTLKPAHGEAMKSVIFGPTCDAVDVVSTRFDFRLIQKYIVEEE